MDDIETAEMLLSVFDDTDTTQVTTGGDHGQGSTVKVDEVLNLSRLKVELNSVSSLDQRVRVSNGAAIVGDCVRDSSKAKSDAFNFEKLVLGLFGRNAMDGKASLGVVEETEVLIGLLDGDNILESSGVASVCSDFSVDFDESLSTDGSNFFCGQSIFQSVSQKDNKRKALPQFVGTSGWTRSPGSAEFM